MTKQLILSNKIPTNRLIIFSVQFPIFAVNCHTIHCSFYLYYLSYLFWSLHILDTKPLDSIDIIYISQLWHYVLFGFMGSYIKPKVVFSFFWGSQILDGFSSLMVSSFFLDLLKKTLHILKIHIRLSFPFLKKWVSPLVFNSTGIYFCIWPEVEI